MVVDDLAKHGKDDDVEEYDVEDGGTDARGNC